MSSSTPIWKSRIVGEGDVAPDQLLAIPGYEGTYAVVGERAVKA